MIANLMPYPTYKDSGVEWLGKVPEHWRPFALKQITRRVQNGTTPATSERDYYADGTIAWYGPSSFGSGEEVGPPMRYLSELAFLRGGSRLVRGPALLVVVIGTVGRMVLMRHDGSTNQQITAFELSPETVSPRFILQQLKFAETWLRSTASAATIPILDSAVLARIPCVFPPLDEQYAIARFLDHADRPIRRYIRAKKRLIKLLEEQKQAIIHQAVTGQIDVRTGQPYPAYKDSGVEWLGRVPAHWKVVRNGQLFVQRNEKGFPELPILEVSLKTGVRIRDLENPDRKQMMSVRGEYKRAVKRDIAYNMMRMWQGAVGVVPIDGLVSPAYVVAKPRRGSEPNYFSALFRTSAYMIEVDKYSRGIVKDRNRLYWEDFRRMPTPFPPPDEQIQITNAIDQSMAAIDARLQRIHRQIELLQEYRTRLIADVVTGKLDVREAAARLPDAHPVRSGTGGETIRSEANSHAIEHVIGKEAVP